MSNTRRVSIGISPALEAASTSIPIQHRCTILGRNPAAGESWWFRLAFEEAIYALAEYYENGGKGWGMRFEVVEGGPGRRGIQRENDHAQIARMLSELATEDAT